MPTQTPPAGSNPVQATDGTPLNPLAVNIAKAIRQQESGGDYNAVGDGGESHGAYQFNKNNFGNWAKQYGFNPTDMSPTNQDKVAYHRINDLLSQGKAPSEVAAIWNGSRVENGKYVPINPQYVESVKKHYEQITQGQTSPQNTQTTSVGGTDVARASTGEPNTPLSFGGVAKGILDFAAPIVGDVSDDIQGKSKKGFLQQAGDAGLTALWAVPGFGELGEAALHSVPLLGKLLGEGGMKLAGHALGGAATGYGADVASNLSQGKTDIGQVFTPGLGTMTGGILGGALSKVGGILGKNTTQKGALDAVQKNIESNLNATKSGRVLNDVAKSEGHIPSALIAQSGAIPDVVEGKFSTLPQQQYLLGRLKELGLARAEALDATGANFNWKQLETDSLEQAKKYATGSGDVKSIQSQIKGQIKNLRKELGSDSSMKSLEKIKERQTQSSKVFSRAGQVKEGNAASYIGATAKQMVEDIAEKSGMGGMKEYNKYMQSHYRAIDALKKLNGQAVKGGRLGNILRGHAAGVTAGIAGSGLGPIGTIGGFLAGEAANHFLSKILGDTALSNPMRDVILRRIEQSNPGIVEKILAFSGKQGKKVAPLLKPKASMKSNILQQGLIKTAVKGVTQQ